MCIIIFMLIMFIIYAFISYVYNVDASGITAQVYIQQVVTPRVVPFFAAGHANILQQDNARAHSARATQQELQRNGIPIMNWPPMSPDLNPVEQIWAYVKRRVNAQPNRPRNRGQLTQRVIFEINHLPRNFLNRLIVSMRRRCRLVIMNNGGRIAY